MELGISLGCAHVFVSRCVHVRDGWDIRVRVHRCPLSPVWRSDNCSVRISGALTRSQGVGKGWHRLTALTPGLTEAMRSLKGNTLMAP